MAKRLFFTLFLVAGSLFFKTINCAQAQSGPSLRGLNYWYLTSDAVLNTGVGTINHLNNHLNPTNSAQMASYDGLGMYASTDVESNVFDGTSGIAFLGGDDAFIVNPVGSPSSTTTPYTSGAYVFGITTPATLSATNYYPIFKFADNLSGLELFIDNNQLAFVCYGLFGGSDDFNRLNYPIVANTPYVITAEYDATAGFMELFVNGVSVGRKSLLFDAFNLSVDYHGTIGGDPGNNLRITSTSTYTSTSSYNGYIAAALLYNNTTLSTIERLQTEASVRYGTSTLTAPVITPTVWYSCIDGASKSPIVRYEMPTTGTSASGFLTDLSGYGQDAIGSTLPTYTSNAIGSQPALKFATGTELQIPSSMMLDKSSTNEERTYCMVVKPTDIITRQYIYKQGDRFRGVGIYIDHNVLYFNFYISGGSPTSWTTSSYSYPLSDTGGLIITIVDKAVNPYIAVNGNILSGLPPAGFSVRPTVADSRGFSYIGGNVGETYDGSIYASEAPFTGYLSSFSIYNKAFSTEELGFLHNHFSTKYGITINQAVDYYRWQEFFPYKVGGLNDQILSSCSDELLFQTSAVPANTFIHIGNNHEVSTDLLVGDFNFYSTTYTVPQNVTRSKRVWRVDQALTASPYPTFGGSTTIDFSMKITDFPIATVLSYQQPILILDADGDFSKDSRFYTLTKNISTGYYSYNGLTVNAGDQISFGVMNVYQFASTYPYSTDFIYQTHSGTASNLININGVKINALNGTSNYNYLGVATDNTTSLIFDPMSVVPKISCTWEIQHYGNVGPVRFLWTPADAGITTALATGEEYVLAYEVNNLSYGTSTQYLSFSYINGQYEIPTLDLPNQVYQFTVIKRTASAPIQVKNTSAILKEHTHDISNELSMQINGTNVYSNLFGQTQYSNSAPQCPKSVSKAYLYLTFNTGDNYLFGTNAFTTQVKVSVVGKTTSYASAGEHFGTFTLNLDQSKPEALQVVDVTDYINTYPYQEFTVLVTDYTASSNATINDALQLKADLVKVDKVLIPQTADPIITAQSAVIATSNKTCTFSWTNPYCDPYKYQFQLLRLFNGLTTTIPTSEQDLINADLDWTKALTLETVNNSLSLTLAEGTGYYAWRVRPIGNYYDGDVAHNLNWGPWNKDAAALTAPLNLSASTDLSAYNGAILYYTQFDVNKNFIYNRAFTEDTKIHEGISYANGLQQINQTQAKINSNGDNGQIVVSESVYDFSGRATLQSMAAPDQTNNDLGYRNSTLINGTDKYNAFNFDQDAKLETPDPIDNGLINLYYSDLNTDPQIPDAENYPYSRSLYDNDGINRTIEQSGVGKMHSMGNKTVTLEYGTASDLELLRIFGDEAPKGSTVSKTKTTDQNNISSITYTDLSGKVIATSLVKNEKSTNLDASGIDIGTFSVVDQLNNNVPIGDIGETATKKYTFSEATDVTIVLNVSPKSIPPSCGSFCYTCTYKAEIKVINDNTNAVVYDQSTPLAGTEIGCSDALGEGINITETLTALPAGTYSITKTITLDETAANTYAQAVTDDINSTLQGIINTHVMNYVNVENFQGMADDLKALYQNQSSLPAGYTMSVSSSPAYVAGVNLKTGDQVTIGPPCCAITFPITLPALLPCEQYAYDLDHGVDPATARATFGQTLVNLYAAKFSTSPYPIHQAEMGDFTATNLQNLFANMLAEPYYDCNDIWNAWDAQIVLAGSSFGTVSSSTDGFTGLIKDANGQLPGNFSGVSATDATADANNPINMFLTELHRKDHLDGFLEDRSDDLREHAYKYFYYPRDTEHGGPAAGTIDYYCEQRYCKNPAVSPDPCTTVNCTPVRIDGEVGAYTLKYTYTPDMSTYVLNQTNDQVIVDFYFCLTKTTTAPASGSEAAAQVEKYYEDLLVNKTTMENQCKSDCEDKRDAFKQSLIAMYDPDHNGTLINALGETIQPEDLCCTVDEMVAYCKDQCYLSIVRERCTDDAGLPAILLSVGTAEEINNMEAIMGGTYQIEDGSSTETPCSTDFHPVESCEEIVGIYHLNGYEDITDYAHPTDAEYNLSYSGSTPFDPGRSGLATQSFDAPYTVAVVTDEPGDRGITKTVTVSAWVYMRNTITGASSVKTIVEKMDGTAGFHLYTLNGYAYFDVKSGGTTYSSGSSIYDLTISSGITADPLITDQTWHLVTGVCTGDKVEIWIDGQYQNSNTLTSGSITSLSTGTPLLIAAGAASFEGDIDEVYIHSCALGEASILNLFNTTRTFDLDYTPVPVGSINCPGSSVDTAPGKLWDQAAGTNTQMLGMKKVSTGKVWSYGSSEQDGFPGERVYLVIVDENGNKYEPVFTYDNGQFIDMIELPNGNYGLLADLAIASVYGPDLRVYEFTPDGIWVATTVMALVPSTAFSGSTNTYFSAKLFVYNGQTYTIHSIADQLRITPYVKGATVDYTTPSNNYVFNLTGYLNNNDLKTGTGNGAGNANKFYNNLEISGDNLYVAGKDRVAKINLASLATLTPGYLNVHAAAWETLMSSDFVIHSMHVINSGKSLTLIGDLSTDRTYPGTSSTYTTIDVGIKNFDATTGNLKWSKIQPKLNTVYGASNPDQALAYTINHAYSVVTSDGEIAMCGYIGENGNGVASGFVSKVNNLGDCNIYLDNSCLENAHGSTLIENWIQYNMLLEDDKGNVYAFGYRGFQQRTDQMITKLGGGLNFIYRRDIFIPTEGNFGMLPGGKHMVQLNNGQILLGQAYLDASFFNIPERTAVPEMANRHYTPPPGNYGLDYWFLGIGYPTTCTTRPVCMKFIAPVIVVPPPDTSTVVVDPKKDIIKTHLTTVISEQIGNCSLNNLSTVLNTYTSNCKGNITESCTVSYTTSGGHYTLYYYDRAGNLVKTVPPEGVIMINVDPANLPASRLVHPSHQMVTYYKYNSLGQLVEQITPDGGTTDFRYNKLGMLRFSQNAKQVGDGSYSFTKFDVLGRTIEVGQAILQTGETFAALPTQAYLTYTDFELTSFPTANTSQETYTVYTDAAAQISYLGVGQQYLRNRVSYSFSNGMDGNKSVSYFSYDPHGNVSWIVQELPGIGKSTVGYEYDLISNKVTKVKLNEDRTDQFFHRYSYDADNRITMVETSPNGYLWDRDASYSYYKHGPLRRTQIGEDHVQGLDYTYTLHGWLKAVNAPTLTTTDDPGQDGVSSSLYQKDEYGFVLGYYGPQTGFNGDFKRTGSIFNNAATVGTSTATDLSSNKPLYNGNITSWSTRINAEASGFQVTGNTYTYDLLNRIKSSTFSKQSGSSAFSAVTDYATTYCYDANGNISKLTRNGAGGIPIDDLIYNYNNITVSGVNTKSNNQLVYVTDTPTAPVGDDIGSQSANNYLYDGIGNLTSDQSANTLITWNVYGKVDQVKQKNPSTSGKPELRFVYDAMGNRIEKEENLQPYDGSLAPQRLIEQLVTTYYVRDASGNVMAIYQRHNAPLSGQPNYYTATYTIKEIPLYGSSRVGVQDERDEDVVVATKTFYKDDYYKVNFEFNLEDQKTEMNNWLTASSSTDVLGTSSISSVGLHQVDFNTTVPHAQALTNIQNFAGVNGKDVNIAENDYGQALFYTVTMAKYWGKSNVLLLFDANGNIMPNSGGILADCNARTVIVQSPVSSSQYVLFTRNAADHKLYSHIIDLNLQGNGANQYDKRGDVKTKNSAVDASNTYGTHLMAIEDRGAGKAYVYATQYKAPVDATLAIGTTELTLFEVSNTGTSLVKAPSKLCTQISSWEDVAQSQLQISPDGEKLTMINHQQNMGWFAAQKTQAIIFKTGANYRLASNLIVNATIVPIGISLPHQSSDFSADSRYVYYSQQRLTPKLAYNTMGRIDLRNNLQSANLFLNQLPQIQRSKTGFVYAYQSTNQWNAYDETTTGTSQAEPTDNLTFSYLASGNTISNYMSVQNRILYKLNDLTLSFNRRVGKKNYELSDHLGNVTVVVSDELDADPLSSYANKAHVETYTGYYAFGMAMPGRSLNSNDYRYGFNGKEKDVNGLGGGGSTYDYGFRIYNPQIAKFLSVDPLTKSFPWNSTYAFAEDRAIDGIDLEGLEFSKFWTKKDFENRLDLLIKNPIMINQGQSSTCAIAAVTYLWLFRDGQKAKSQIMNLFNNGSVQVNNFNVDPNSILQNQDPKTNSNLSHNSSQSADWVTLNSIQDAIYNSNRNQWYDVFDTDKHTYGEKGEGGTRQDEIETLMTDFLNLKNVTTRTLNKSNNVSVMTDVEEKFWQTQYAILYIDAGILQGSPKGHNNHAVTYEGGFSVYQDASGNNRYKFSVQSWGESYNVDLSESEFNDNVFKVTTGDNK